MKTILLLLGLLPAVALFGQSEPQQPAQEKTQSQTIKIPDISIIVQAAGRASDNRNCEIQLSEVEIGIQGYVNPNVKADAFITMRPAEDETAQVEEAYLAYMGLRKGLNFYIGQKHVPFGRTNLLHDHSWLYARQPFVISTLVASENLIGQGAYITYLVQPSDSLFAELDLGTWSNADCGRMLNLTAKFNTARLWMRNIVGENSELEFGGSWANGKSAQDENPSRVTLTGVDLTYKHYGEGAKRLLLRGESFWHRTDDLGGSETTSGYYLFANYRPTNFNSLGLLYDMSEYRTPGGHQSAVSVILTKQYSEQYYLRLQATHGARSTGASYNELWLQWGWGFGPHTHNFE